MGRPRTHWGRNFTTPSQLTVVGGGAGKGELFVLGPCLKDTGRMPVVCHAAAPLLFVVEGMGAFESCEE